MTYPDQPRRAAYPHPGHGQSGYPPYTGYPAAYTPAATHPAGPSAVPPVPGVYPAPYGLPAHQAPIPDAHWGWSAAAVGLTLCGARALTRPAVGHPALYLFGIVVGIGIVLLSVFVALAL